MAMTTTEPAPEVLLTPPPGFVGLPLHLDEQRSTANIDALATKLTSHAGEGAAELPRYVTWFAHLLAEKNIRLYGQFAVEAATLGEAVLVDLAVAIVPLHIASDDRLVAMRSHRDVTVAQLRQQYLARHPHATATVVRVAMGQAMAAVTAGEYRLPPDLSRYGSDSVLPRIAAEFQIPTPDGSHLVMLTASTANEAARQAMLAATTRVANSVRVTRARHNVTAATPSA